MKVSVLLKDPLTRKTLIQMLVNVLLRQSELRISTALPSFSCRWTQIANAGKSATPRTRQETLSGDLMFAKLPVHVLNQVSIYQHIIAWRSPYANT